MPTTAPAVLPDHRYRFATGGCPIEAALDVLGGRWKGLLLCRIALRPQRFNELRKSLPHVSQRMLVRQLRELERDGLILRSATAGTPSQVHYSPTVAASELLPLLLGLSDWGSRHLVPLPRSGVIGQSQSCRNAGPTPGAHRQPALR